MEQKSITALISAFSRAYHATNSTEKIFDDKIARMLFSDEEYLQICETMTNGISFFNPNFNGDKSSALRWIVNNQLAPSPLGRAVFAETTLKTAVLYAKTEQYLILGAGYDTFAYRQPCWASKLQIFEIDCNPTSSDKKKRLEKANIQIPKNLQFISADFSDKNWLNSLTDNPSFNSGKTSFCSILGVSYYLSDQTFKDLISSLYDIMPEGSSILFDYPNKNIGEASKKQIQLAKAANEEMLAAYSYQEIEKLLSEYGFLIYEHLSPQEITHQFFEKYNLSNYKNPIKALENVNYCLAVKKSNF